MNWAINGEYYASLRLHNGVKEQRRGILNREDNLFPLFPTHSVIVAKGIIMKSGFKVLDHPLFCLYLDPSNVWYVLQTKIWDSRKII